MRDHDLRSALVGTEPMSLSSTASIRGREIKSDGGYSDATGRAGRRLRSGARPATLVTTQGAVGRTSAATDSVLVGQHGCRRNTRCDRGARASAVEGQQPAPQPDGIGSTVMGRLRCHRRRPMTVLTLSSCSSFASVISLFSMCGGRSLMSSSTPDLCEWSIKVSNAFAPDMSM
jgi:hypothetical protein